MGLHDYILVPTTLGRTPLDEWSARCRDLSVSDNTNLTTDIHAPGAIRTHNPSQRVAANPRLRQGSHWYYSSEANCLIDRTASLWQSTYILVCSYHLCQFLKIPKSKTLSRVLNKLFFSNLPTFEHVAVVSLVCKWQHVYQTDNDRKCGRNTLLATNCRCVVNSSITNDVA